VDPQALALRIASLAERIVVARMGEANPMVGAGDVALERPKKAEYGDWASSVALKLSKPLDVPPRELAEELATAILTIEGVSKVDVAGPGFLNITLDAAATGDIARTIVEAGESFGSNDSLAGKTFNVEFVSTNPTGPLHVGHTRWAALGDSLVRVLRAAGATVISEFYINDAGNQMDLFGQSVLAKALGTESPEGAYPGQYIDELAQALLDEHPGLPELSEPEALVIAREFAYNRQLHAIQDSLRSFRVHFDVWFSERQLHRVSTPEGLSLIDQSVDRLRAQGHVFDDDGAVWVKTTDFGDDKDRVIRRGNGVYTYFAADAAYYLSKKDRGANITIYLLGADHHGYVHRLKAIAGAAGDNPDTDIEVLIGQLVMVNGARLSKRAGNIIELDDLHAWLGTDALRYSLGRYPADSPLTLEPDVLLKRSNDNPVFYVQYAHARCHQVRRNALSAGVDGKGIDGAGFDPSTLTHPTETELLTALADFPRIVAQAAELREPHRVARYLEDISGSYHRWYDACRVTPQGDDPITPTHHSRLWVNDATAQVLRNGLDLLGVDAPERM
jgi:arginyl-tRNA synthetase